MIRWLQRTWAVLIKEFIQMRRDRLTFAMLIGIPIVQLTLFGYAINTDPKNLPAAVHIIEESRFSRTLLSALRNTGYFEFTHIVTTEAEGAKLLKEGTVAFVVTVPAGFERRLLRGEAPQILIEADASDPSAASNALAAIAQLPATVFARDLSEAGASPVATVPVDAVIHRSFNPEGISAYNIVPGLLGVILTMTMVLITALAVTREIERGTMENLLAMPITPGQVMMGKIIPYIFVGYIQVMVILIAARFLFHVPMIGSLTLLSGVLALFIAVNLAVGFTISTLARNQLQAMQMTFFFFLPSILLSGFMFPFRGMPVWAQYIGEALPLTHFLRLVRGILLKGAGPLETAPHVWPLLLMLTLVTLLAMNRYRRTLD
ncbi:MAG: ABC transporter permease [Alphaproteobacteria bacterium]|nr:ABC transporter permease [Alphaproteobacteria bacterium]